MEQYHALIQRESRAFAARLLENDANVPVRNQLKLFVPNLDSVPPGLLPSVVQMGCEESR